MTIVIERKYKKPLYSIGLMYVDGKFFCDTMEDTDRFLTQSMSETTIKLGKVYGQTAIPTGTYEVRMTYSSKYKRKMPQVMNVKGFTGIRIHSGNTADDTLGCILLGKNTAVGKVTNSRANCDEFEKRLIAAGGKATLTIK